MNKDFDFSEYFRQFFAKNPHFFGIVLVVFGVFLFLAAIKNWKWVFQGNSYNTKKLEGINNLWGRGAARLAAGIGGISCIIFGIIWFAIYEFYYQQ